MATNPSFGDSYTRAYLEANKTLAKTMCIKSQTSAESINDRLIKLHGQSSVDKGTPRSWKYYLNISGQYHNTDTLMMVTSLDTLQEISFTKENLIAHNATLVAYRNVNSRYYYSLLNRYPGQEQLILGILYPADIDNAIEAKDGSILSYPTELVEAQEQTLLIDLEGFIQRHMQRWNVQAFGLSDTLYNASYHAQLYLTLLPKLLNLRLMRCKTNEVHTFHIRQYLASHGRLDRFLPYMTLRQALFLYRNICYLIRNTGKSNILELLIRKILTDRQIPVAEYSIRHLNSFDDNYYPEVRARRKPINDEYNIAEKSYVSPHELFNKEDKLVSGNNRYRSISEASDVLMFKNSSSSVVQTKNLESNMVDYNDAVPDPFDAVLLRQWAFMSSNGLYNVVVTFKDPKTSEDRSLYTKDALIYFTYVSLMSIGITVDTIPDILVQKYRKVVKPSVEHLISIIDNKHKNLHQTVNDIWLAQPEIVPCYSSKAFFTLSQTLYEESIKHWKLIGNTHDLWERGALDNVILQFYADKKVSLGDESIDEWLTRNNLPDYDYTHNQAQELMVNIFTASTGLTVDDTKVLKNIQRNMLELLGQLSSYTIQLIREINDSKIRPLNWAAIRLGKGVTIGESEAWVKVNNNVIKALGSASVEGNVNSNFAYVQSGEVTVNHEAHVPIAITTSSEYSWQLSAQVPMSIFYQKAIFDEYNADTTAKAGFAGMEFYLALNESQKASIKDIYS